MKLHIDGDIITYRAGFAAEKAKYVVSYYDDKYDEVVERTLDSAKERDAYLESLEYEGTPIIERYRDAEPVENAIYNARSIIRTIVETSGAQWSDTTVYLTGEGNYRDSVATIKPYKGNRLETEKPVHAAALRAFMMDNYPSRMSEGEEADDLLGIAQMEIFPHDEWGSCIATLDKDLDMIPGLHYNFVSGEMYFVDSETADWYFYRQLLTGDSTDNIPGIPGIGKAKAEKALTGCTNVEDMYELCRNMYIQSYGEEFAGAALLENARLLWIRRTPDEMWEPPKK